MPSFRRVAASVAALSALFSMPCNAKMEEGSFEEPTTGVNFTTWASGPSTNGTGGVTLGMALPADAAETDATEYIGYLKCDAPTEGESGWCGVALSGKMVGGLLLVAWPSGDQVLTSFRMAGDYAMPDVYAGDSALTQIASSVTDEGFELVYRCEDCLAWTDGDGEEGGVTTSEGQFGLGYAQGKAAPENPECEADIVLEYHTVGHSTWVAHVEGLPLEEYEEVAELATEVVDGDCGGATGEPTDVPSETAEPTGSAEPTETAEPTEEPEESAAPSESEPASSGDASAEA